MADLTTRFTDWGGGRARAMLAALAVLILYGLALAATPIPTGAFMADDPMTSDTELYRGVTGRVAAGEGYYDAVVAEHRARGYPLRPFLTVRPPYLASLSGRIGLPAAGIVLQALALATIVALALRFRRGGSLLVPGAIALGIAPLVDPALAVWHEAWAGLLIALSIAVRGESRWIGSLALGLAAALLRELAMAYLLAMAAAAFWEGRRREGAAWLAALALAVAALAVHAWAVAAHVSPDDIASPGWAGFGGLRLVLTMVTATSWLSSLSIPLWGAALVVPLALLGWWSPRDPEAFRAALTLTGYAAAFLILGRNNNAYWGFLISPLLMTGLAFVPVGLRTLLTRARPAAPAEA